ncbi:MAG: AraC family transcriptional regulator [Quisquiliibacterium sp.]
MQIPTFEEFKAQSLANGYDEVLVRQWSANQELALHDHPFAVTALVIEGEMWLTKEGQTQHLLPGDRFDVGLRVKHAERYGPQGTTFWAARKHG